MSTKRASTESGDNDQPNEDSDAVRLFQKANRSKRDKQTAATVEDTTLQDLPIEIIEYILVKVVAMEVIEMRLAKSVWKEKAELVIERLGTVCTQWSSICATEFFLNELHRTLDGIAQETMRFEILHQSPLSIFSSRIEAMRDEVFILSTEDENTQVIHIFDRNNLATLITAIRVSTIYPASMKASNLAKCVYLLVRQKRSCIDVMRIYKDDGEQFVAIPFLVGLCIAVPRLSVGLNGCLMLSHQDSSQTITTITQYDVDARVKASVTLQGDRLTRKLSSVIEKSNGNLVLIYADEAAQTLLTEINKHGIVQRKYQSTNGPFHQVARVDAFGRILTASGINRAEVLDSELNVLETILPRQGAMEVRCIANLAYNEARDEIVTVLHDSTAKNGVLTFFHFS